MYAVGVYAVGVYAVGVYVSCCSLLFCFLYNMCV